MRARVATFTARGEYIPSSVTLNFTARCYPFPCRSLALSPPSPLAPARLAPRYGQPVS